MRIELINAVFLVLYAIQLKDEKFARKFRFLHPRYRTLCKDPR